MNNVGQMVWVISDPSCSPTNLLVQEFRIPCNQTSRLIPYLPYCSPGIPLEFLTTAGSAAIFTVWHEDIILPNDYLGEVRKLQPLRTITKCLNHLSYHRYDIVASIIFLNPVILILDEYKTL